VLEVHAAVAADKIVVSRGWGAVRVMRWLGCGGAGTGAGGAGSSCYIKEVVVGYVCCLAGCVGSLRGVRANAEPCKSISNVTMPVPSGRVLSWGGKCTLAGCVFALVLCWWCNTRLGSRVCIIWSCAMQCKKGRGRVELPQQHHPHSSWAVLLLRAIPHLPGCAVPRRLPSAPSN
jgi:hypothetical protein